MLGAQTPRPVANTLLAQALDPRIKLPMSEPRSAALGKLLSLSVPQFPPLSNSSNPTGPLSLNHNSKVQKTLWKPNVPLATHLVAKSNRIEMSLLMALAYPLYLSPGKYRMGEIVGVTCSPLALPKIRPFLGAGAHWPRRPPYKRGTMDGEC